MYEDKINFHFPSKILQNEDFSPIESTIFKDYYRNSFLKIIDKVRNI
jgi:hypothetical protein